MGENAQSLPLPPNHVFSRNEEMPKRCPCRYSRPPCQQATASILPHHIQHREFSSPPRDQCWPRAEREFYDADRTGLRRRNALHNFPQPLHTPDASELSPAPIPLNL